MSCYGEGNRGCSNSASKYRTRLALVCASIRFPQQRILVGRVGRDPERISSPYTSLSFPPQTWCFLALFSYVSGTRICQVAQSLAQENRLRFCANLSLAPSPADEGALYFVRSWGALANLKFQHAAEVVTQIRSPDPELVDCAVC